MNKGWPTARLDDAVIFRNSARVPIKSSERVAGPTPYYGASGAVDHVEGFTHEGDFLLLSEDGENLRSRSSPIAFLARGRSWVNNHAHVLEARTLAELRFLEHAIAMTAVAGYLTGSGQPKLTQQAARSIQIPYPPETVRRAIGEVLGAFDDKIAANRGTISAAEQLLTALADSGDAVVAVDNIARRVSDTVDPSAVGVSCRHFSLPAFDEGKVPASEATAEIKSSKQLLRSPSVLVSKLNPRFPRVWNVPSVGSCDLTSTEFVVLEPTEGVATHELWATLSSPSVGRQLESRVSGTSGSHQRVKPADVLAAKVKDPRSLPSASREALRDIGALAESLRAESVELARTRDELLPLLMSGRLTVKDAEKRAEEVL